MIWKYGSLLILTVVSIVGITIPVGGSFFDAAGMLMAGTTRTTPVSAVVTGFGATPREVIATDPSGKSATILFPAGWSVAEGDHIVCDVTFDASNKNYPAHKLVSLNPMFTFPFIPGLEERARIMFFHVPMSWVATIAFFVSMIYGIMFLRTKENENDVKSAAAAGLGLMFCILATVSGSIWAKFNWGSYWNWDPRETSIFILLLVYGAYFALRSAIEDDAKRGSLAAVYSILATVTVPFFIFIMPRIMPGLHPGSQGDVNSGPVISGQINASMRVVYLSAFVGFLGLFIWLFQLRVRVARLAAKNISQ